MNKRRLRTRHSLKEQDIHSYGAESYKLLVTFTEKYDSTFMSIYTIYLPPIQVQLTLYYEKYVAVNKKDIV